MRVLSCVAFGCVDRLPRWKLTLPLGLKLSGEYPIRTDGRRAHAATGFTARPVKQLRQLPKKLRPSQQHILSDVSWAFFLSVNILSGMIRVS